MLGPGRMLAQVGDKQVAGGRLIACLEFHPSAAQRGSAVRIFDAFECACGLVELRQLGVRFRQGQASTAGIRRFRRGLQHGFQHGNRFLGVLQPLVAPAERKLHASKSAVGCELRDKGLVEGCGLRKLLELQQAFALGNEGFWADAGIAEACGRAECLGRWRVLLQRQARTS